MREFFFHEGVDMFFRFGKYWYRQVFTFYLHHRKSTRFISTEKNKRFHWDGLEKVGFGLALKKTENSEWKWYLAATPPTQVILDGFGSPGWLPDIFHPTLFQVDPFESWGSDQKGKTFQTEEDLSSIRKLDSVKLEMRTKPLMPEELQVHKRKWAEHIRPYIN